MQRLRSEVLGQLARKLIHPAWLRCAHYATVRAHSVSEDADGRLVAEGIRRHRDHNV